MCLLSEKRCPIFNSKHSSTNERLCYTILFYSIILADNLLINVWFDLGKQGLTMDEFWAVYYFGHHLLKLRAELTTF